MATLPTNRNNKSAGRLTEEIVLFIDVESLDNRKWLASMVDDPGEKGRKYESFKQWEIYSSRIKDYVINELKENYDEESIREMPVQSSINLAKRITNEQSVVYKQAPERIFDGLDEDDQAKMKLIYEEMRSDKKLAASNRAFKLQEQNHLMCVPKEGKLILRTLKNHQVTVIPNPDDPETAMAYVVTSFNKDDFLDQNNLGSATGSTAKVDQFDDSKEFKQRQQNAKMDATKNLIVWTKESNFSMDSQGNLTSEIVPNPLAPFGLMPFVDISSEKEFEYWVRKGTGVTDFTVEFNKTLSDVATVIKMQGFAQAVLKGPESIQTSNVKIGPTYLLKITTDANSEGGDSDFKYVNPNSDIRGSLDWLKELLSYYLSSEAIDPKTVTASGDTTKATSGLDRLLQMIQQLSASMDDFETYDRAEKELYEIVKAWITVLSPTDGLKDELSILSLPKDSKITTKYKMPEMIQSEGETLGNVEKKKELGMTSRVREVMSYYDVDRDKAIEMIVQFDKDEEQYGTGATRPLPPTPDEDEENGEEDE